MNSVNRHQKHKKVVFAPTPSDSNIFISIYSVEIDEDEEVEWQWLELPDGNRVVIDYKIISHPETQESN